MSRGPQPSYAGSTRGTKKRPTVRQTRVGDIHERTGARCVAIDSEGVPRRARPLNRKPARAANQGGGR